MKTENLVERILDVLENDILPLTKEGIAKGNKIFGAAILKKSNLDLVIAGTNKETENPLFHGEISCINNYWAMPKEKRPEPKDCLFLSTHEPCSLCLSAITWSGFDNFYYLFSYEDSRDEFNIPHDLNILKEVFLCEDGGYAPENEYWKSYSLMNMIAQCDESLIKKWNKRISRLRKAYGMLSSAYQENKTEQDIPLG
jgi:tRNA(Arg) A34 adenosine deaminase TadA